MVLSLCAGSLQKQACRSECYERADGPCTLCGDASHNVRTGCHVYFDQTWQPMLSQAANRHSTKQHTCGYFPCASWRGAFQVATLALEHLGYDLSESERRCLVRKTSRAWRGKNHDSAPADQASRVDISVDANVRPFARGVLHLSRLSLIRLSRDASLVHGRSPLRC